MKVPSSILQISTLPKYVKIVEVGPRDGLQNEKVHEFSQYNIRLVTPMISVDNLFCDFYHSVKKVLQP